MTEAASREAVRIVPAAVERWNDVALVLDGESGSEKGCWCQSWRGRDGLAKASDETRPDTLRRQLGSDSPPPGFVAYIADEPVGWVGVSVRGRTPRLDQSRTIPAIDDRRVWAIGCFRIRAGFRRRGVASALLDGVVAAARGAGAPGVEAYPIDPAGRRVDPNFAFTGLASMFDRAGFRRVLATDGHSAGLPRLLVRLDLPTAPPAADAAAAPR